MIPSPEEIVEHFEKVFIKFYYQINNIHNYIDKINNLFLFLNNYFLFF